MRMSLCFAVVLRVIQSRPFYPKKGTQPTCRRVFWSFYLKMTKGGSLPKFTDS